MTDAAGASRSSSSSSQQQQHAPPPPTSPARPLTRSSAMSARLAGQATGKQPQQQRPRSGPESSTTTTTTIATTAPVATASSAPSSSSSFPIAPNDTTGHSRLERLSLTTPASATATASPRPFSNTPTELICLCTPAPKVPRPRNAFILYRQHHQGQVVAENPGLANPEISKIIGEQWRDEPEENKNQWKRLAEEEKQRHRHQFPDYRYQPRRGNKAGGGVGSASSGGAASARTLSTTGQGEDPGRCPNCGGRYIATPTSRTPHTPFGTPTTARPPMPPPYGNTNNPRAVEGSSSSSQQQQHMSRYPDETSRNRAQWYPLYDIHEEYGGGGAMSPADSSKRRRYNMPPSPYPGNNNNNNSSSSSSSSVYPPLPSPPVPYGTTHQRHMHPPTPIYGPPAAPGPLPGPSSLARAGPMGPPPPPPPSSRPTLYHHHHHPQQQPPPPPQSQSQLPPQRPVGPTGGGTEFDESLRLPPLQTHLPTSPDSDTATTAGASVGGSGLGITMAYTAHRDAQAQSLEAMVMSIPYINKIHVLQRISPPLPPPPPPPPPPHHGTRGRGGSGSGGSTPRAITTTGMETRGPVIAVEGSDGRLRGLVARVVERALGGLGDCFVRKWVGRHSGEGREEMGEEEWGEREGEDVGMLDVGASGSRSGNASRTGSVGSAQPASVAASVGPGQGDPFGVYLQAMMEWHARSSEMVKFVTTPVSSTADDGQAQQAQKKLPVALLPSGYSLTESDRFACTVPVGDSYAPVDHWQWMATLWRGVVGPDLVVYVRGVGGGGGGEEGEMERTVQGVEVRNASLMVVRLPVGGGAAGEVERVERRLEFE
ncbi:HMG box protein, partial [Cercophora scortea]